jgi:hypothetical protein
MLETLGAFALRRAQRLAARKEGLNYVVAAATDRLAGRVTQKVIGAAVPSDDPRVLIYREGRVGGEFDQATSINHHVFSRRAGSPHILRSSVDMPHFIAE